MTYSPLGVHSKRTLHIVSLFKQIRNLTFGKTRQPLIIHSEVTEAVSSSLEILFSVPNFEKLCRYGNLAVYSAVWGSRLLKRCILRNVNRLTIVRVGWRMLV